MNLKQHECVNKIETHLLFSNGLFKHSRRTSLDKLLNIELVILFWKNSFQKVIGVIKNQLLFVTFLVLFGSINVSFAKINDGESASTKFELTENLCTAAKQGNIQALKMLIAKKGVNLNAPGKDGDFPLLLAAGYHHLEAVDLLIKSGADFNAKRRDGATPLIFALYFNDAGITNLLLHTKDIDLSSSDRAGFTPLHYAVLGDFKGSIDVVKWLTRAKSVNVNATTEQGYTPLSFAAQLSNEDLIKVLLKVNNIDVNMPDKLGRTPLYWLASKGDIEGVKLLLKVEGIDVNKPENEGYTPLLIAAVNDYPKIVELLIRAGANLNSRRNEDGATPLFLAAKAGRKEVVKILANTKGVDVNLGLSDGGVTTPLCIAAGYNRIDIVESLLLTKKVNIEAAVTCAEKNNVRKSVERVISLAQANLQKEGDGQSGRQPH